MQSLIAFGAFLLDEHSRVLTFRGGTVPIGPREFDLLNLFALSSAHVLAKDEIKRALWPNRNAKDAAITQAVYRLRQVLRAHDPKTRYIVSIPTQGYRFVYPVRVLDLEEEIRRKDRIIARLALEIDAMRELLA